jgi:DnaJ-domain-containing protein 1
MHGRLVPAWSFARFREQVSRRRFALVGVARGRPRLEPALIAWFDHQWPDRFAVGTLDVTRPPERFVDEHFRPTVGALRLGPEGLVSGVYLFDDGAVAGLHNGVVGTPRIDDAVDRFVRARVREANPDGVVGMTRYLSEIVERRLGGRERDPGPRTAPPPPPRDDGPRTAPPPPPRSPPTADTDHALLGVAPGVSLKDLTAAYREQLKLNHPDKVAHLSPALQQFAHNQTLAVMQAYERLKSRLS